VENRTSHGLHVLTITSFFPSEGDEGTGCFVAETLRELGRLGATSSIMAVDSIYHRRRVASRQFPAEWLRYPQLPGNFGLSSAGTLLSAILLQRVRKLHARSPINVIHAHAALPCGHAAAILSRRLKIPFVVTVHGLDVFNRCFEDGQASAWRRKSSLQVYTAAAKVICISQKVQRLLAQGASADIPSEVVYNGTDPNLFSPGSSTPEPSSSRPPAIAPPAILVVGTLLAGKGQELVLHAVAALTGSHPALQCQIIGEGGDKTRFEDLAGKLGIRNRVHFLGRRTRAQVAEAMRNCTVFVLPSRYEGLGCVYLEAMACGKPAIGCFGQGIDEIIQDGVNGELIPVDGLEPLVRKLQVLLLDSDRRLRLGQAARTTILDGLTLSHQARRLRAIYEAVGQ
jgi:teichuronic acid biosynthesis glycosyltransferase TuaC